MFATAVGAVGVAALLLGVVGVTAGTVGGLHGQKSILTNKKAYGTKLPCLFRSGMWR